MKADLPVVYRKSAAFFAAFPCPLKAIRPLLPHPLLTPITLTPGKGALVVAVFDHQESSLGAHREVAVGFMARLRTSGPLPLLPLLADRYFDDVGAWMLAFPTTSEASAEVGRAVFGSPKFMAEVSITRTEDHVDCEVSEGGERMLQISMDRPGFGRSSTFPLRSYSALGDDILFTEMAADAVTASTRFRPSARLEIAPHAKLAGLDPAALTGARPLEVRFCEEYRTMLDRPAIRYRMSA